MADDGDGKDEEVTVVVLCVGMDDAEVDADVDADVEVDFFCCCCRCRCLCTLACNKDDQSTGCAVRMMLPGYMPSKSANIRYSSSMAADVRTMCNCLVVVGVAFTFVLHRPHLI